MPKFSATNAVNVTMCQRHPAELEDLTLIEEYAVARSHPIAAIPKLKPRTMAFVDTSWPYREIQAHFWIFYQALIFTSMIRRNRIEKQDRADRDDLKPFVVVRKEKVIRALLCLCENNPLDESVQI
jgi:hypothetical protein